MNYDIYFVQFNTLQLTIMYLSLLLLVYGLTHPIALNRVVNRPLCAQSDSLPPDSTPIGQLVAR